MDPTTRAVRDQYDRFPYPEGQPVLRVCWDVRYLLAQGEKARPKGRPLHALDAGCGRGLGLTGAASTQPDVCFLGIDISGTALDHARANADQLGLKNAAFATCDLMTLDGLDVPAGGFDVIYSSGVLHHLVDPAAGLARLREVLAPHGVIQFMVYGRLGRQALERFAEAVRVLLPADTPLADRLAPARRLAAAAEAALFPGTPWEGSRDVGDVEFVDRFLNVNETAYDVPGLFDLAAGADLRFLRWNEPEEWLLGSLLADPELQARASRLDDRDRYHLVELLAHRHKFECLLTHADNGRRPALTAEELPGATFVVNPDVTFAREVRNLRSAQRVESLKLTIRTREPISLPPGPEARAALLFAGQARPFKGREFVKALGADGVPADQATAALVRMAAADVVYRPHPADV